LYRRIETYNEKGLVDQFDYIVVAAGDDADGDLPANLTVNIDLAVD
jgi:hypothetical protein